MKTTFILHGGETKIKNENNREFYKSWTSNFDEDRVPKILLNYFAGELKDEERKFGEDVRNFEKYNGRKADFEIADRNIERFREQIKKADVIYVRGGSSNSLINLFNDIKEDFKELIKGKIYVGSSAGTVISEFYRSHTTGYWKKGLGILPVVSFVHWREEFEGDLEKFKKEKAKKDFEYVLLPETEFIVKEVDL